MPRYMWRLGRSKGLRLGPQLWELERVVGVEGIVVVVTGATRSYGVR